MLSVNQKAMEEMIANAGEAYPEECCGVMLGQRNEQGNNVCQVLPIANTAENNRTDHFRMDPLALFRVEQSAEEKKLEIVGFYHSHPDCEAVASSSDIYHMLPGYSYLIISVAAGVCRQTRSFEKTRGGTDGMYEESVAVKG